MRGLESGPDTLNYPTGVALHPNGRILISDAWNHLISVVSSWGRYIQDIRLSRDGLVYPRGLAVSESGQVAVACRSPNVVAFYDFMQIA